MVLSEKKLRFQLPDPEPHPAERILDVVVEMLESGGYDAVQLREVARRARIGLGTIYKLFPTRDDLIVTAIEHWMDMHTYAELAQPVPGETLYEGLMRVFRDVYEPWERSPRMLEAFHRARSGPGGERLQLQGANAIVPVMRAGAPAGRPGLRPRRRRSPHQRRPRPHRPLRRRRDRSSRRSCRPSSVPCSGSPPTTSPQRERRAAHGAPGDRRRPGVRGFEPNRRLRSGGPCPTERA